jgi:hypothetical protein
MLDISYQMTGGFLQSVNQWGYLRHARVWHQQPCDGKCGFFKLLELAPQLLAVFIKLLQRFIAVDKVRVRGDPKLHVRTTLMGQLLIIILKYLAGIFLSVEDILHISLRCLQLFHPGLKICKQLRGDVRLLQGTPNKYPTG